MDNSNDIMERMQALLSDPESLKQLQELSNLLEPTEECTPSDSPPASPLPNVDFSKVLQLIQTFNSTAKSQEATLLLAIKPYLSSSRQVKVDRAIKLLHAYDTFTVAKDSGLLSQLDGFI